MAQRWNAGLAIKGASPGSNPSLLMFRSLCIFVISKTSPSSINEYLTVGEMSVNSLHAEIVMWLNASLPREAELVSK